MTQVSIDSAKSKIPFMLQNRMACTFIEGYGWVNGLAAVRAIAEYDVDLIERVIGRISEHETDEDTREDALAICNRLHEVLTAAV